MEAEAATWEGEILDLPRPAVSDRPFWFSFSGLKTAVIQTLKREEKKGRKIPIPQLVASFQEAVADVLVGRTMAAAAEAGVELVTFSGGVACNRFLRERLASAAGERGIHLLVPPRVLCTDNGAMIAGIGYHYLKKGERSGLDLSAVANLGAP
jgi:N6-L-threonylcarbamoyladenine synthase